MATVLVTGAGGFVGSHVASAVRAAGHDLVPISGRWSDADDLARRVGDRRVDAAVHLGWYALPADYLVNVEENLRSLQASVALARLLPTLGCSRLVAAGSCAEYAPSSRPLREGDALRPRSVYGATKAAAAALLDRVGAESSMRVTWARIFNVTGPGEATSRLLPWVRDEVRAGRRVPLSDGTQVRDFLDVTDVADALVHLVADGPHGACNVGSGVGVTLGDLLLRLAYAAGGAGLLDIGARPRGADDPDHVVADTALLTATGWTPRLRLDDVIERVAGAA